MPTYFVPPNPVKRQQSAVPQLPTAPLGVEALIQVLVALVEQLAKLLAELNQAINTLIASGKSDADFLDGATVGG